MSQHETTSEMMEEEVHKAAIEKILPLEMGATPKAELVLVILGLKPAMDVDLAPWNSPPELFEDALRAAGLAFVKTEQVEGGWTRYAVARTQETADRLHHLDPTRDHKEFGTLMGFPETAIAAFEQKQFPAEGEVPVDPTLVVGDFKLSRDHWQEELEIKRRWNRAIQRYAPDVYQALGGKP